MSQRFTTLLTAAVLTAAPVALTGLPASAATCTSPEAKTQVAPGTVVVDTTGVQGFDVLVAVKAHGCTIGDVQALVTTAGKASAEFELTPVRTEGDVTTYAVGVDLSADQLSNADAGTWRVRTTTSWTQGTTATDDDPGDDSTDDDSTDDDHGTDDPGDDAGDDSGHHRGGDGSVTTSSPTDDEPGDETEDEEPVRGSAKVAVVAAADLTADATSSQLHKGRIQKGKALTVKGVLTRADWERATAVGYGKQKVDLQFRTPKGSFTKVRTLQTRSGGAFAETVKVSKDGCYRVVFAGSATTAAAPSRAECIDVR